MNSLYLHIPYCISRCGYCDFHSSTCLDDKDKYIEALCMEIKQRKDYLDGDTLDTIYFGGGTPSLLDRKQLERLFNAIRRYFAFSDTIEITLEANPNDINESYLSDLLVVGFNRLSIGVQSFNDDDLKIINRRHSAQEAIDAVNMAKRVGFKNISIDLIFGLPLQSIDIWQSNLQQAMDLGIQHISSYNLMFEKGTDFYRKRDKGLIKEIDEELSLEMYRYLIEKSSAHGFIHYETSNFALEGYHSQHNSNYWCGESYLGVGASAHSYNGKSRRWNISDNTAYIQGIKLNSPRFELEVLDIPTAYNEYIMTGLRTIWGCNLDVLKQRFGSSMLDFCMKAAQPYINTKQLLLNKNILLIAPEALFVSDQIMSDLMYIND